MAMRTVPLQFQGLSRAELESIFHRIGKLQEISTRCEAQGITPPYDFSTYGAAVDTILGQLNASLSRRDVPVFRPRTL